jgi:hypothetical protein
MAQFVICYGPNASSDIIRQRARCTVCGHKGAMLRYPSWVNRTVGVQPFPVEHLLKLFRPLDGTLVWQ